jgi:pseudaminic acid synthase
MFPFPNKPFVIAEMSGNHNQSLQRALEIVDAAADSGAHALKIQTYTPDTITIDCDKDLFFIKDKNSLWEGKKLYDLYAEAMTPWDWHEAIFARAKEKGMLAFSSPFDESAVDFLEKLNVPFYKIASFENNHHPLLKKVAQTGKPVIISTGISTAADIYEAVKVLRDNGCKQLVLLKCTSTYPATPVNSNILTIPHMRDLFGCEIGLSDHTGGIGVSVAAVALGATVIEKHFTLKRNDGGVDSAFSLEPSEMKQLVIECQRAYEALGKISYEILEAEKKSSQFKRSIYVVEEIKKGEIYSEKNLRIIRPGGGLAPKYLELILGKTAKTDLEKGTPFVWDLL